MGRIAAAERSLYERAWALPEYAQWSPGLAALGVKQGRDDPDHDRFTRLVEPYGSVIDFGCGSGVAGVELARRGFTVRLVDQTDAGLVSDARTLPFHKQPIWKEPPAYVNHGFCVDVLEHLPTEMISLSVYQMVRFTQSVYLEVSTEPDAFGTLVGEPLHKTVKPFVWWRDLCGEIGTVIHGIDMLTRACFVVER